MTLLEFINARLDEDDATALAVGTWGDPGSTDPLLVHICRHFPDRMLRRTSGERALLATADDDALRCMAATWNDHADYDPEWA